MKFIIKILNLLFITIVYFQWNQPIFGTNSPELNYFIGTWNCKNGNNSSVFSFEEMNGGKWIIGKIEENDSVAVNEYWRVNDKYLERRIFTADGSYLFLSGELPIQNGKIILKGSTGTKQKKKLFRSDLEIISSTMFKMIWRKNDKENTVLSEEVCEKPD